MKERAREKGWKKWWEGGRKAGEERSGVRK